MILLLLRLGGRGTSRRPTLGCHRGSCGQAGSVAGDRQHSSAPREEIKNRDANLALQVEEEYGGRHCELRLPRRGDRGAQGERRWAGSQLARWPGNSRQWEGSYHVVRAVVQLFK